MKKSIKIDLRIAIFIGLLTCTISIGGSYGVGAYALTSKEILYNNTSSSLQASNVQDAIDGTCTKFSSELTNIKNDVISQMYPVGSIYISTKLSTPDAVKNELKIGTWKEYGSGRVLKGTTSTAGTTGGDSSAKRLTVNNLPSHSHSYTPAGTVTSSFSNGKTNSTGAHTHNVGTNSAGRFGGGSANPGGSTAWLSFIYNGSASYPVIAFSSGAHTHTVTGSVSSSFSGSTRNTNGTGKSTPDAITTEDAYITVYMYQRTN